MERAATVRRRRRVRGREGEDLSGGGETGSDALT